MTRDPSMFTLWWTSTDRQASMWFGDFATEEEADSAIDPAKNELREMYGDFFEEDFDEGSWTVEPPDQDE